MVAMLQAEPGAASVDEYIAQFPPKVQEILERIRGTIQEAAPEAGETISYRMPAFTLEGPLVYFAAYKRHIGFYPTNSGISHFQDEFAGYKFSKGAVQFPLDRPVPHDLIRRIVLFRVQENLERAQRKR